jgi:hypothetical protein
MLGQAANRRVEAAQKGMGAANAEAASAGCAGLTWTRAGPWLGFAMAIRRESRRQSDTDPAPPFSLMQGMPRLRPDFQRQCLHTAFLIA